MGVLTGVLFVCLLAVLLMFAAARYWSSPPPSVAQGSTLVLDLEGEIPERPPVEYPVPLPGAGHRVTVENVWSGLKKAAADRRITAVVLAPESLDAGWGKLQEIRDGLKQFRKSGKPLYAYLRAPGAREYYLATAADRIYLAPEDFLNLKGMRVELVYFKSTLDKLGVQVEVEHAGKYKDFGDMFTRTSMSPETREVLTSVLDELYSGLVGAVAEGRRKGPEEVRELIDQGPFLASRVVAAGLIDAVSFEDEMYTALKQKLQQREVKKISIHDYSRVPAASLGLEGRPRIALVVAEGGITRGDSGGAMPDGIESGEFTELLRRVKDDSGIRGVVVRIDSPGGEVAASDEIWRKMNLLSRKKPLVISMSDSAASGGYYISMTGDPIVAYPGTFTGSIGVVFGKPNLRGLYDKLGITKDSLTRGRFADIDSDYKPLGEEGRRKLQQALEESYRGFVSKVAQSRRRKVEEIEPLAQGRVWLGSQARQRGLVDELGGLDRALELVKQKAKIPVSEKVAVQTYPPRRTILDLLTGRGRSGLLGWLESWEARLALKGGPLRLMPYSITVQ
ncbi:MAG: signal peptide peptidase SppA [Acidobacteria bacterium]|nr:signal peptide peptidase SppA [Acidobacteriota bacterium]